MDQRLSQVGLRQPRGESKIRSIGDCSFKDQGVKTPIEGTPNPDIEPGIGISANAGFWRFLMYGRLTQKKKN
jgi:hypothetical protein